jgi:hypothetical protein
MSVAVGGDGADAASLKRTFSVGTGRPSTHVLNNKVIATIKAIAVKTYSTPLILMRDSASKFT